MRMRGSEGLSGDDAQWTRGEAIVATHGCEGGRGWRGAIGRRRTF